MLAHISSLAEADLAAAGTVCAEYVFMSLASRSNTRNTPEPEYQSCMEALLGVLSESETQQYYQTVYTVLDLSCM